MAQPGRPPHAHRVRPDDEHTAVSVDVVRRFASVNARISAGNVLSETLQAIADGIVDVLGFGVAVVNHRLPGGDFAAVAISGPGEAHEALAGAVYPRAAFLQALEISEKWGTLRFIPHERQDDYQLVDWVPDIEECDGTDAWHPMDMLLAPLQGSDGEVVGILSVDLPPGNVRPDQLLRELLELFVMQAGLAISAVELRESYRQERQAHETLLRDMALRDALTGLWNRRGMTELLSASVERARAGGAPGALLFCDVDGLKQLNDREGHLVGDRALRAWAQEMGARVRGLDQVCRLGGDEFVVIADGMGAEDAERVANRLREPQGTDQPELAGLTLSVGVAIVDGTLDPEQLLERADQAMYADKSRRRAAQQAHS